MNRVLLVEATKKLKKGQWFFSLFALFFFLPKDTPLFPILYPLVFVALGFNAIYFSLLLLECYFEKDYKDLPIMMVLAALFWFVLVHFALEFLGF